MAYLDHIPGGEITVQLLVLVFGVVSALLSLGLLCASGFADPGRSLTIDCAVRRRKHGLLAPQLPRGVLEPDELIGQNVGIFGAVLILATDS